MSNEARFEVFPEKTNEVMNEDTGATRRVLTGEFGWRFKAADGKISAVGGEAFTRREDAHRGISDFLYDCGAPDPSPPTVDLDVNGKVIA